VGVIDAEGAAVVAAAPATAKAEAPKAAPAPAPAVKPAPAPAPAAAAPAPAAAAREVIEFPGEEGGRVRSSPLVRRIAKEHNVNLAQVPGTGLGGRVSKQDIMSFIEKHGAGAPAAPAAARPAASTAATAPAVARPAAPAVVTPAPAAIPGELVPMSAMRKKIAERMVESKRTSAHVHSVFEVDMTRIVQLREREKAGFEQRTGSRLTFTTFFCRAAVQALRLVPIVNSSVEGDSIRYHRNIHLGVAVSLDWGLIVPVIKNAEEKNFLGLQRAILDLAERARSKKLAPDDVAGGTFTITNPGSYGQMFGLPIIPQPQVAIMGVGSIKKQPVVVTAEDGSDSIAIRSICHISMGYDHRIVDGAVADQFLAGVAKYLEGWNEDIG
jgi:pyruvate dehydrogenase E2 component (dihydrolipoamide acetyltransferase)